MASSPLNYGNGKPWKRLAPDKDVWAAIVRARSDNPADSYLLQRELADAVEAEAKVLQAPFDRNQFSNVTSTITSSEGSAYFIFVSHNRIDSQLAGAAIQFPHIMTLWNEGANKFDHYPAILGEDTFVYPEISRHVKAQTGVGLGTYFTNERIRLSLSSLPDMPFGMIPRGRISECSPEASPAMVRIYGKLGVDVKKSANMLTFGIRGLPDLRKRTGNQYQDFNFSVPANPEQINSPNYVSPILFSTTWRGNNNEAVDIAGAKSGGTYLGHTVSHITIKTNGRSIDPDQLDDALRTGLWRMQARMVRWIPKEERHHSVMAIPSRMRIHADQDDVYQSLLRIKAIPRTLGPNTMRSIEIDFRDMPQEAVATIINPRKNIPEAEPLQEIVRGPASADTFYGGSYRPSPANGNTNKRTPAPAAGMTEPA